MGGPPSVPQEHSPGLRVIFSLSPMSPFYPVMSDGWGLPPQPQPVPGIQEAISDHLLGELSSRVMKSLDEAALSLGATENSLHYKILEQGNT